MLVCRHCGWENPDEAAFCTNCGRGLNRGRVIAPETAPTIAGARFRALGSPVITVQASEPPRTIDPPLPSLKAPPSTGSAPTLLDFRMPEQMLAELARMREARVASRGAPIESPDGGAEDDVDGPPEALGAALQTAASRGLGDIARALRAEMSPAETRPAIDPRPTLEQIDPPTLEPGIVEIVEDEDPEASLEEDAPPVDADGLSDRDHLDDGDDADDLDDLDAAPREGALLEAPLIAARPTLVEIHDPPSGLFTDPPVQELPFFESMGEDDELLSMPPGDVLAIDEDEADLPFVLGPELEVDPPHDDGLPPGDSVDLLPPDGSVDFESEALDHPGQTQEDVPAVSVDESDGFSGLIESAPDDGFSEGQLIDDDVVIEDVDDEDSVLDSGDMEAVIVTQTEQPALRPAPPPMPAAVSARFVLRPLSENLDESFVVAVGDEPIDIGRLAGDICFEDDRYLSPLHARFEMTGDTLQVTDLDSLNGIWLRVRDEAIIEPGTMFLCGQQVIRLEAISALRIADSSDGTLRIGSAAHRSGLQLAVISADGEVVTRHQLPPEGCRLGRHVGDMVFTRDSFMSGTHALVRPKGDRVLLRDLDSRNGTWLRLGGSSALEIGDAVMLGRTVLRVGQPSG